MSEKSRKGEKKDHWRIDVSDLNERKGKEGYTV